MSIGFLPGIVQRSRRRRRRQTREPERLRAEWYRAVVGPGGGGFPHRRRMLEAVAGARRDDQHAIRVRMHIDDEPEIGRHGIKTRDALHATRSEPSNEGRDEIGVYTGTFRGRYRPFERVRR